MEENIRVTLCMAWRHHCVRLQNMRNCLLFLRNMLHFLESQKPVRDGYCLLNREQKIIQVLLNPENDLKSHIRVSRNTFSNIIQLLDVNQHHGWDLPFKLMVFLFWLACGASYRVISCVFHMPKSTIHQIVHEMMEEVLKIKEHAIKLPKLDDMEEIGRGFVDFSGKEAFRSVCGAIDGCHVEILAQGPNHHDYFNRKLRYSIQFQAVCDNRGRFIDIFAGYPGSVHDSRVLRASPLYRTATYPPRGHVLLGDSGYPCIVSPITIITPYKEPLEGPIQKRFNTFHSRTRNIIERAFGMLKTRWRCIFLKKVCINYKKVANLIGTCCVVHNICILNEDFVIVEEEDMQEHEVEVMNGDNEPINGHVIRDFMARELSQLDVPMQLMDHDYL